MGEGRLRRETVEGSPPFVGGEARAEGERRQVPSGAHLLKLHGVVPGGDPCLDPALQRAHAQEPFVHHQSGDTRRARFVRSTAVNHDVAQRRHALEHALHRVELGQYGAGNAPRIGFARER